MILDDDIITEPTDKELAVVPAPKAVLVAAYMDNGAVIIRKPKNLKDESLLSVLALVGQAVAEEAIKVQQGLHGGLVAASPQDLQLLQKGVGKPGG